MSKFPRLEMMRAQRQRREDELTAPYRAELRTAAGMISSLRATIRKIESVIGTDIGKRIFEQIGSEISHKLMKLIYEAVAKARGGSVDAPVRLTLPHDFMRFSDPRSIEAQVLRQYAQESAPKLSLRIEEHPTDRATVVDVRLPELGYRQIMMQ